MKHLILLPSIITLACVTFSGCTSEAEDPPAPQSLEGQRNDEFESACLTTLKSRLRSPATFNLISTNHSSYSLVSLMDEKAKPLETKFNDLKAKHLKDFPEFPDLDKNKVPQMVKKYGKAKTKTALQDAVTALKIRMDLGLVDLMQDDPTIIYKIDFEYDAQNGYGALIRSSEECKFTSSNGNFVEGFNASKVTINGLTHSNWIADRATE